MSTTEAQLEAEKFYAKIGFLTLQRKQKSQQIQKIDTELERLERYIVKLSTPTSTKESDNEE